MGADFVVRHEFYVVPEKIIIQPERRAGKERVIGLAIGIEFLETDGRFQFL